MGLKLFVAPKEPEDVSQSAEKAPARARSRIRRQPTIRGGLQPRRIAPPDDSQRARNEQWEEIARMREASNENMQAGPTREERRARARFIIVNTSDLDHEMPTDSTRTGPGGTEPTLLPPLMPPVPEMDDMQGLRRLQEDRAATLLDLYEQRASLRRLGRQPPRTSLERLSTLTLPPREQIPSLTPDFSPARRYLGGESLSREHQRARGVRRVVQWPPGPILDTPRVDDSSQAASANDELPPLRRVGRHISTESDLRPRRVRVRLAGMDGLGDRDRSLSPDGDGAWDTILTTLTPDPQPPSLGSSFTSASASAAASASSNTRSTATSLTTMDGPADADFEAVCDIIEDVSEGSATDAEEEDDIYELQDNVHTARDNFWRSYADVVAARAARVARHSGAGDADSLGGMQRIVRRLARREDIPDEWWAEAGLSRNFQRETAI